MKNRFFITILFLCWTQISYAFSPFVVQDIRVEGLQRVSVGTVFNYFPLRVKESVNTEQMAAAVRSLYESGLFKDVSIEQDGRVVVIRVLERPVISTLVFKGNKDLKSKNLLEGYKQVGIAPGRVLNRHSLELAAQDLKKTYVSKGRYGTRVVNKQVPLERNRVALVVEVREGVQALVDQVKFVGNRAYADVTLLKKMEMKPASWYAVLSKRDKFSQEKLSGDVDRLRNFYLDRGFLNFKVTSTHVALTPNKKSIVVSYQVSEGTRFFIKQVAITGVDNAETKRQLLSALLLRPKQVYSREAVVKAKETLENKLGDLGYALAEVQVKADPVAKSWVNVGFTVNLGYISYIRKIKIIGNSKTRDDVVRRELREYEGGRFSATEIELSVARLRRLGYFETVSVEVKPAEGTSNQVDVVYTVVEKNTGNFKIGLGYSQTNGLGFTLGLSHENFLGTGKKFSLDVSTDKADKSISFDVTNPFFTKDGVSLSYGLFYNKRDTEDLDVASYSKDELGFSTSIGVPVNEYDKIVFGVRASVADFTCGEKFAECNTYVKKYGKNKEDNKYRFNLVDLYVSWARDTRDRAVFATSGVSQKAVLSFGVGDAKYRKLSYKHQQYLRLSEKSALKLTANLGYGKGSGDEGLPFFNNYFTGGADSVRGFSGGSLAPRTQNDAARSLGGSFKTVFNIDLITPLPFLQDNDSVRLDTFIDVGYVFKDKERFDSDALRSSYGVGLLWLSPVGPLSFSVAKPIREKEGDREESFQFQLGNVF